MIIDAHAHYYGDHVEAVARLRAADIRMVNVAVAEAAGDSWREQATVYRALATQYPDTYAWCTTFDPPDDAVWADVEGRRRYAESTVAGLRRDFEAGAAACKVWKSIGMKLRKPSGEFVLIDDAVFDPVYAFLASIGKPLLMHIGEPLACWQPLEAANPHAGYYRANPEWYMGDKPDHPTHRALIDARDRVLARHPRLRAVGAHLGSLEYDVTEIAARLDRYPNFAVDTSARLTDLVRQDQTAVRSLFPKYPDRILFGTDIGVEDPVSALDEAQRTQHLSALLERYAREADYYRRGSSMALYGVEAPGLGLPSDVADAVLAGNALRWYWGE